MNAAPRGITRRMPAQTTFATKRALMRPSWYSHFIYTVLKRRGYAESMNSEQGMQAKWNGAEGGRRLTVPRGATGDRFGSMS